MEKKNLSVQAADRVLSWNRTNYFGHANALWFYPWLCHSQAARRFLPGNYSGRDCRFAVVITLMSLRRTRQYYYSMRMFPFRHNRGEMRAHDIRALMLHHLSCVCANCSTFCAIRRRAYFTLFQPAKAHHHRKVECHLLHVSHLHQVTLSFQIVLISSLPKVSPFPG